MRPPQMSKDEKQRKEALGQKNAVASVHQSLQPPSPRRETEIGGRGGKSEATLPWGEKKIRSTPRHR